MVFVCAEAAGDMNVCYILDGVLILYGIILTVLYCRLRVRPSTKELSFHAFCLKMLLILVYFCLKIIFSPFLI